MVKIFLFSQFQNGFDELKKANKDYMIFKNKLTNQLVMTLDIELICQTGTYLFLILRNVRFLQKNYLKEQKGPGQVQWTTQHWQRANKQQALCEFASIYDHLHMLKLVEIHKEYNIFLSFHDFFSKTPPRFEDALQLVLQTVYVVE